MPPKQERNKVLSTHQVFKLHVQVLPDGELRVRNGLVKVGVQIVQHLNRAQRHAVSDQRRVAVSGPPPRERSALTGLMVFSSWMPYFSMLRCASANFTKASQASACGSRTPMTEKTSPNAGNKKNNKNVDPSELLHVYYTNLGKFQKNWDDCLNV